MLGREEPCGVVGSDETPAVGLDRLEVDKGGVEAGDGGSARDPEFSRAVPQRLGVGEVEGSPGLRAVEQHHP